LRYLGRDLKRSRKDMGSLASIAASWRAAAKIDRSRRRP
jgi:hypothetical protein